MINSIRYHLYSVCVSVCVEQKADEQVKLLFKDTKPGLFV